MFGLDVRSQTDTVLGDGHKRSCMKAPLQKSTSERLGIFNPLFRNYVCKIVRVNVLVILVQYYFFQCYLIYFVKAGGCRPFLIIKCIYCALESLCQTRFIL